MVQCCELFCRFYSFKLSPKAYPKAQKPTTYAKPATLGPFYTPIYDVMANPHTYKFHLTV